MIKAGSDRIIDVSEYASFTVRDLYANIDSATAACDGNPLTAAEFRRRGPMPPTAASCEFRP